MRNIITINLDENLRCDCLANVDEGGNTIELELVHISWNNPVIHFTLTNGVSATSTDYEIDGSLQRSLYYTIPEEYWNADGELSLWVTDGSFTSGTIHFTCNKAKTGERVTVKANGTAYTVSVYVPGNLSLINMIYPIGSVIENANANFNPNTAFPGTTWERIKGKVLVGVDEDDADFETAGKTGGEKTHTLAKTEVPNAKGNITFHGAGSGGTAVQGTSGICSNGTSVNGYSYQKQTGAWSVGRVDFNLGFGNGAHNNLQPYETVYIWKRTA